MEKVRLTKEQADAIERFKSEPKADLVKQHVLWKWESVGKSLNDLTIDELIRALYIGYEVEPQLKVGDWIHDNITNRVAKIDERGYDGEFAWVDDEFHNFFTDFRHATLDEIAEEKQRRWWEKHGRNVWELRVDDVLYDEELNEIISVRYGGDLNEQIRNNYRVVCFAEDRKDV